MASNTNRPKAPHTAVDTLAAILAHVAMDADNDDRPTDDDRDWAQALAADTQRRLNAMRRARTPRSPAIGPAASISAELQALARPALIAQLGQVSQRGDAKFAHRDLTGLTDDDLRQLLAVALAGER